MPFKISNLAEYDSFVTIDIGTSRVRVLACQLENGTVRIVGSSAVRQSRRDILGGDIGDIYSVARTVGRAITQAYEGLSSIPDDVLVSINSPSLIYDTLSMNYVRERPDQPITMDELDEVIHRVEHRSIERVRSKIQTRLPIVETEMKLVTTSITSITIDGQRISNPVGFTGKNIRLRLINVFVPIAQFQIIKGILRELGKNFLAIIPVGIALPKLMEDDDEACARNLYVDVGAWRTTAVFTHENEILGVDVLPVGGALLEESLVRNLGIEYVESEDLAIRMAREYGRTRELADAYLSMMTDAIEVAARDIEPKPYVKHIFLSGGGATELLAERLRDRAKESELGIGTQVKILTDQPSIDEAYRAPAYGTSLALARIGQEVCMLRKDPIAKILRYVIYRHE